MVSYNLWSPSGILHLPEFLCSLVIPENVLRCVYTHTRKHEIWTIFSLRRRSEMPELLHCHTFLGYKFGVINSFSREYFLVLFLFSFCIVFTLSTSEKFFLLLCGSLLPTGQFCVKIKKYFDWVMKSKCLNNLQWSLFKLRT